MRIAHQLKEPPRLLPVVGVVLVEAEVLGIARQAQRRLGKLGLGLPLAKAVGLVVQGAAVVAVHPAHAVAVVAVHRAARGVHRDLMVVGAQAVALRVGVVGQARLQHAVGAHAYAGHQVAGGKGGLLHVGEEVLGVFVELELAHLDQRVVGVRPDLGQVERVVGHALGVELGHDLHVHGPLGEVAAFDGFVEIALVALAVTADQGLGLGVREVLDALLRLEVELDPEALARGIPEAVGVRTKAVHVAVARRNAALAHDDGDLVQGLWDKRPVVPVVRGRAHVGARVALDGLVQVGELARVANEEHRRVVAHHVPVALLGIELEGKAADVALGVGRTALARHGGEAREHLGLLADLAEDRGAGVARDVVRDREGAKRARALGMHAPLGNHLAHEVGEFFVEPHILGQQRAAWACGQAVTIRRHGGAEVGGQVGDGAAARILAHGRLLGGNGWGGGRLRS